MTDQPAAYNLLRLSFDTHRDYLAYEEANRGRLHLIWSWHEGFGNRDVPFQVPGICDLCDRPTAFEAVACRAAAGDPFAFRVPWRLSMTCACGLPALHRAVLRALLDAEPWLRCVYHVGGESPFTRWLCARVPQVVSSHYEEGRRAGEIEAGIRFEDLAKLSFPDAAFDCVICMDILEHVADYLPCLREIGRTLTPGGRALLTFPFLGGAHYDHLVRAEKLPDGSIRHLAAPEYHDDPANPDGILSFRAFGWKILDEIRDAGFARASVRYLFGPLHGHLSLVASPIVVAVR
jgi:hypothetical protein